MKFPFDLMPTIGILLISLVICDMQKFVMGATVARSYGIPVETRDLKKYGRLDASGRVFSGDVIYYADVLIKSGVIANLWPRGILYYEFDSSVSVSQRELFLQACQAWSANSPVKCVQRNSEQNFVRVATHNGEQCAGANTSCSALGMRGQGKSQDLFVYSSHWTIPSVLQHELGHAFGLIHEQQRPDRDAYITILTANIRQDALSQFSVIPVAVTTEYDFDSIMHYKNCAFSTKNCDSAHPSEATSSMLPKACSRDVVGGDTITSLDTDGLREAYLPEIYGLYSKSRHLSCGIHSLSPKQVALACPDNNCQAGQVVFNKKEDFHHEECSGGFLTDPASFKSCPAEKTLISSSSNSSALACGFGSLETKYYWDWACACALQSLTKLCFDPNREIEPVALSKLRHSAKLEDKAAAHYIDQLLGWNNQKLVEQATVNEVRRVLADNYLSESFVIKIYRVMYNMRLMIELGLYTNPNFKLKHADFLKILQAEGM
jgi:hypothetical protein